jgi:hypothetical protein
MHRLGADANAVFAAQCLAAEFEQYSGKFRFFGGRHKIGSGRDIAKYLAAAGGFVKPKTRLPSPCRTAKWAAAPPNRPTGGLVVSFLEQQKRRPGGTPFE